MLNLSSEIRYASRIAVGVVLYSVLFTAVSCTSTELELKSNAQVVKTPAVQVSNNAEVENRSEPAAIRLTELYESKNCKEFFDAFPSTFEEFDRLYGFDDEKGERILYSKYQKHVSYLFDCSEVTDLEKLKKSIEIGINGQSEADASALVQDYAFELIKDYPNEAKEILDNLPDEKAASFWYFLFDGPHPNDKGILKKVDLLRNALGKNSKQLKLLSEQYQKLLVDWSEH